MPAELREHQHEISSLDGSRALVFGTEDTGYLTLTRPAHSGGDVRAGDTERPGEDGIMLGRDYLGAKAVTFEMGVLTDAANTAIAELEQEWATRVAGTNLVVNPRMQATAGTVTVATNLVPNTRMRATAGTVTVAENLMTDPSFAYGEGGFPLSGQGFACVRDTTRARTGTHSFKITADGTSTANPNRPSSNAIQAGKTYTFSAWAWNPASNTAGVSIRSGGTVPGEKQSAVHTARDQWVHIVHTFTMGPDTPPTLALYLYGSNGAGDVTWWDDVSLVEGTVPVPQGFSGDTPDDATFTYAWVGTPGSSKSTKTARALAGWSLAAPAGSGAALWQSGADAATLRIGTSYAYAQLPMAWPVDGATVLVDTVTADRNTTIYTYPSGNTSDRVAHALVAGQPVQVRDFYALPTGTSLNIGWATSGASPGALLTFSGVLVAADDYRGDHFGGDTPDDDTFTYAWTGAVDASTSTKTARKLTSTESLGSRRVFQAIDDGGEAYGQATGIVSGDRRGVNYRDMALAPGTRYTVLTEMRHATGGAPAYVGTVDLGAGFTTTVGTVLDGATVGTDWTPVRARIDTPPDAVSLVPFTAINSQDPYDVRRTLVVEGDYNGPYFDGDSGDDLTSYTHEWLGVPHASASQRTEHYLLPHESHRVNLDYLNTLEGWWRDERLRNRPRAMAMLRSHEAGRTWRAYGRPRGYEEAAGQFTEQGYTPVVCVFNLIDDRYYSDTVEVATANLLPPPDGGIVFPIVWPMTTVPEMQGNTVARIGGNRSTWVWVEFVGPCLNPSVTIGDLRIGLVGNIADGESVTVDPRPWQRTVLRSDGASVAGMLDPVGPPLRDCKALPGNYDVVYKATDITGTSTAIVRWRSARSRP